MMLTYEACKELICVHLNTNNLSGANSNFENWFLISKISYFETHQIIAYDYYIGW